MWGFSGTLIVSAHTEHWRLFGLPQEPSPGECWEVRWETAPVLIGDDIHEDRLAPIARNVTAELKEATRD
jgi:hypothetical protein